MTPALLRRNEVGVYVEPKAAAAAALRLRGGAFVRPVPASRRRRAAALAALPSREAMRAVMEATGVEFDDAMTALQANGNDADKAVAAVRGRMGLERAAGEDAVAAAVRDAADTASSAVLGAGGALKDVFDAAKAKGLSGAVDAVEAKLTAQGVTPAEREAALAAGRAAEKEAADAYAASRKAALAAKTGLPSQEAMKQVMTVGEAKFDEAMAALKANGNDPALALGALLEQDGDAARMVSERGPCELADAFPALAATSGDVLAAVAAVRASKRGALEGIVAIPKEEAAVSWEAELSTLRKRAASGGGGIDAALAAERAATGGRPLGADGSAALSAMADFAPGDKVAARSGADGEWYEAVVDRVQGTKSRLNYRVQYTDKSTEVLEAADVRSWSGPYVEPKGVY
jgi:NACalpha-BTF3-like transcription factor